jgi:hypothetical protein
MEDLANEGFVVNEDVTPSPRVKRWRIGNGGKYSFSGLATEKSSSAQPVKTLEPLFSTLLRK